MRTAASRALFPLRCAAHKTRRQRLHFARNAARSRRKIGRWGNFPPHFWGTCRLSPLAAADHAGPAAFEDSDGAEAAPALTACPRARHGGMPDQPTPAAALHERPPLRHLPQRSASARPPRSAPQSPGSTRAARSGPARADPFAHTPRARHAQRKHNAAHCPIIPSRSPAWICNAAPPCCNT